jgi:(S)-2-hydroxyglutarate dehydrogenase
MRVTIIGGGIVGLATAYKLLLSKSNVSVTVLEKETEIARHQSTHNSGVLHAGLYYKPGSAKARLAVDGIRQMTAFAAANEIPHEICGKLVVAAEESEVPRLRKLEEFGRQNGLKGVRWLEPSGIRQIEPNCAGVAALHVPEEGIIDYGRVCRALAVQIQERGGSITTGFGVRSIEMHGAEWVLRNGTAETTSDFIVGCAGLQSDRVVTMSGAATDVRIVPFRGEYYTLSERARGLVRNLIYPVPDAEFPFLGVHFTRMIGGGVEAGPNAVLALSREGYRKSDVNLRDVWDAVSYRGLRAFLWRYPTRCLAEIHRSFSTKAFGDSLRRLVPDLRDADLKPGGAGVRAQAMTADGNLAQDFVFVRRDKALHVVNAPSPGATASLAIADEIVRMI